MMNSQSLAAWTARQGRVSRAILWVVATIGPLFLFGFLVGYVVSIIRRGGPSNPVEAVIVLPLSAVAFAGCLLLLSALRYGQPAKTPYERRYNRAILLLGAIGGVAGMGWAMLQLDRADKAGHSSHPWLFESTQTLSPGIAIAAVLLLVVGLGAGFAWYHRIIDDHEERSVLWGSTIGYYFMLFAVPCWLLLAAAGLLPAMTGFIALALVIVSTFVQAGVWAWLKYR